MADPSETESFVHPPVSAGPRASTSSWKKTVAFAGLAFVAGCGGGLAYHASVQGQQGGSLRQHVAPMDLSSRSFEGFLGGEQVMLRVMGTDFCLDDAISSGSHTNKVRLWGCDGINANQIFRYDSSSNMLYSSTKKEMCLDDGGAGTTGMMRLRERRCDATADSQKWAYDPFANLLQSKTTNLCVEMTGVGMPLMGSACNPQSKTQKIEVILPSSEFTKEDVTKLLESRPFLITSAEKGGMCLDDGGGMSPGETDFTLQPCDASSVDQIFKYLPKTHQIVSVRKNLCMDDGGSKRGNERSFRLAKCDQASPNQRFEYTSLTGFIRNPDKRLCVHDGGDSGPVTLRTCAETRDRHFNIVTVPRG